MSEGPPLLSVRDLEKHYPVTEGFLRREVGRVRAVDGVSFDVRAGETFGLVGESGCGKSTTAHSVLRLVEPTAGEVRFDGEDVLGYDDAALRRFRRRAQLVPQDPDSAFDPRMTVGEAVAEPLAVHGLSDADRRRRVVEDALERVGLSADDADDYPHEFSGGEKQRLALARALVLNPDLLVADEPASALDGRTTADVLALLDDLRREFGVAVLVVSHDVDLVRRFCDRVAVMYLGEVLERGPTDEVLADPRHPYTRVLLSSVPSLDPAAPAPAVETLTDELPDASDPPPGCRFHTRCPAIIPPRDVDLPREQWRNVVSLRFHLQAEWADAAELRASLGAAADDGAADLEERLRAAFDPPDRLADDGVEAALPATAEALAADDLGAARERLAAVTETVCERVAPDPAAAETDRPVACHRYDPSRPGDPPTGAE